PTGVAYDMAKDRLLVLRDARRGEVTVHGTDGHWLSTINLGRAVGTSLAFDAEKRELYAPVGDKENMIAIFDEEGKLLRMLEQPAAFVDVGQRSFVRVF